MINIKQLELQYFQNDEPCPYKLKCGYELFLYPIKVKDWSIFEASLDVLKIDKNEINDIKIIQMSYLEFMIKVLLPTSNEKNKYIDKFMNIFAYSMKELDVRVSTFKNKPVLLLMGDNETVKAVITSKEFDEIKRIIMFQNIKDYDDRIVNSDVKNLIKEYYSIKYRDAKFPSLEEQKTYVIGKTGFSIEYINNMSHRMFSQVYKHLVDDVIYIGRKIIQGSEKYKTDGEVQHPLYEKPKDKYEEIFTSTSVLSQKGIVGAEQLNNLNNQELK